MHSLIFCSQASGKGAATLNKMPTTRQLLGVGAALAVNVFAELLFAAKAAPTGISFNVGFGQS
ncbi:hypothetical protein ACO0LC_10725 [Undibacterium sp. JH2W]|uniref:hypothetical protein n=1 Tax=Undibacterium sp. JH2W TaxID=3413037 RepID=UPI003BF0B72C